MRKKGFTLIEMIIVMAIVSVMSAAIGSMLISYSKIYKNSYLQNRSFNYLNEAMSIIEREINLESRQVETNENIIKINYFKDDTVNYIKRINSSIVLLYGYTLHKNVIVDDIKDFIAIRNKNMIYIKIVWNSGHSIERCIGIENAN